MFRSLIFSLTFIFLSIIIKGQIVVQEFKPCPVHITNNAVAVIEHEGRTLVYSFAGMDSSLSCGRATLQCYKYDFFGQEWTRIQDLPQPVNGIVAAAASTVKDKIYVFGGYHIRNNCSEVTTPRVNILHPGVDTFERGPALPVPVDDHAQAVWRDSLIYLISGWSTNTNVNDVQIFNPANKTWLEGTSVPDENKWKTFGSTAVIVEDTIYVIGGAQPNCFSNTNCFKPSNLLRKGVINPNDPTQIEWTAEESDLAIGYRMAGGIYKGKPVWFGGSSRTYNFDGLAYEGEDQVLPNRSIRALNRKGELYEFNAEFPNIMDFRGLGQLDLYRYVFVGGINDERKVSDRTFMIQILDFNSTDDSNEMNISVTPNPVLDILHLSTDIKGVYNIYDISGKPVQNGILNNQQLHLQFNDVGIYYLSIKDEKGRLYSTTFIKL